MSVNEGLQAEEPHPFDRFKDTDEARFVAIAEFLNFDHDSIDVLRESPEALEAFLAGLDDDTRKAITHREAELRQSDGDEQDRLESLVEPESNGRGLLAIILGR